MSNPLIGFVGVGRMGANMARRLHDVGYRISAIYDHRPAAAEVLAQELGAKMAKRLADVTREAEVIFTVVTDDRAQLDVFTNPEDNLLQGAAGKIFVNCATVSPHVHVEVARLAQLAGAQSLEGCMASSIDQARAGTLYLMCAGDEPTFQAVRPILAQLSDGGKSMRYIGPAGRAAQMKALVNMVMNINTAGLAEGLGLAEALGLDLKVVMEVFGQTGASSRILATDGADMINREHACYFSAAHAAKDSGIALELGKAAQIPLPLAAATYQQYRKMIDLGLGELDKSGIAELTFRGRSPAHPQ